MLHLRAIPTKRSTLIVVAVAAIGLLAALSSRFLAIPTGRLGQALLRRAAPDTGNFHLSARNISFCPPFSVRLDELRLNSGLEATAPRLYIRFSPWWLMTGRLRISDISAPLLSLRTQLSAADALKTIDALDAVPLRKWFPGQLLPGRFQADSLAIRSRDGRPLLRIKDLQLRRRSEHLELEADSALVMGFLPVGGMRASGRLPLTLDTFQARLPEGMAGGHLENCDSELVLHATAKLRLGSFPLHLEQARATGTLSIPSLRMQIPLGSRVPRLSAKVSAHDLRLSDFSYSHSHWVKQFVPELRQVGFSTLSAEAAGPLDGRIAIESLNADGDTLRLHGKGWINLEGELSLGMEVGLGSAYAKTRPPLMRAALRGRKDGFSYTGASLSGSLERMQVSPGEEAIDNAMSHPLETLGALLR
jgi:hypothetical protein